jgi:hypothetical protein
VLHAARAGAGAVLLALALLLSCAAAVKVNSEGALSSDGPVFVVSTPTWTLVSPIVAVKDPTKTGLFFYKDQMYMFTAPRNKVRGQGRGAQWPSGCMTRRQAGRRGLPNQAGGSIHPPPVPPRRVAARLPSSKQREETMGGILAAALAAWWLCSGSCQHGGCHAGRPPRGQRAVSYCLQVWVAGVTVLPAAPHWHAIRATTPLPQVMTSLRFLKLQMQPAQINGAGVGFVPDSQPARIALSFQLPKTGVPTLPAGAPPAQLQGNVPYAAAFGDAASVKSQSNTGLKFVAVPKLTQGKTVELLGRPSTYTYWLSPTGGVSMGGFNVGVAVGLVCGRGAISCQRAESGAAGALAQSPSCPVPVEQLEPRTPSALRQTAQMVSQHGSLHAAQASPCTRFRFRPQSV